MNTDMRITFNRNYLILTVLIFLTEVSIALFVKDRIIRPFVGDVLVVVLMYCFLRVFLRFEPNRLAFSAFLFACLIEVLQFFDYVKILGLENNRILSVAMGRTFEWSDFAAYFFGFLTIVFGEWAAAKFTSPKATETHD